MVTRMPLWSRQRPPQRRKGPNVTYNPALPTSRDEARLRLGDTSGTPSTSPATEYLPDATYDAKIVALGDWRLAAADLARALAARAINQPSSFTAVGDMSVSWTRRAENWLAIAGELEAEAGATGAGTITTITMPFLTGGEYAEPSEAMEW
jgi:hypothetical protein